MVFFFLNIEGWKVAAEQQLLALELEILRQVHGCLYIAVVWTVCPVFRTAYGFITNNKN